MILQIVLCTKCMYMHVQTNIAGVMSNYIISKQPVEDIIMCPVFSENDKWMCLFKIIFLYYFRNFRLLVEFVLHIVSKISVLSYTASITHVYANLWLHDVHNKQSKISVQYQSKLKGKNKAAEIIIQLCRVTQVYVFIHPAMLW